MSHFATWDAAHYLYLSELGYSKDAPSCAFYPLWPLLVRWSSQPIGGNQVIAGILLSNACSIIAFGLFFRVAAERFGAKTGWLALAFLALFPGSIFFQFVYSESLFLLLLMLFVFGLERRLHWLVWVSGFFLPLTRAVGIFCALPLGWQCLAEFVQSRKSKVESVRREVQGPKSQVQNPRQTGPPRVESISALLRRLVLLGSAPLLGYALYFGLMWHWTGNPLEGFQAQRFWDNVHSMSNLWDVKKFVVGLVTPTAWHAFRGSVLDRSMFILLLYCLPVIWKLDKTWFIWALVLGVIPAMSGTFTSYTRFASVVFPMFIALGVVFANPRLRWARYGLLVTFAALHAVLVWRFVNFRWAG